MFFFQQQLLNSKCMFSTWILWHVKAHEDDQQEEGHVARTERPRNLLAIAKQQHIQHLQVIPNILQKSRNFYFQASVEAE